MSHRVTIVLSNSEFSTLQKKAVEKEISLAECIRSLVNIGHQTETTLENIKDEKKDIPFRSCIKESVGTYPPECF